jgi:site-specific DNA-methyltransferase (adenine-specific)
MDKLKIEYISTDKIIPYKNNPRKNDDAVPYVMESIKEFGFKVPIIIDKDNVIVAGHTRLKAAKELGLTEVPTIKADDLTEEQIKAFRLADNKVSEKAEWDMELLGQELEDLNIDMELLGFDEPLTMDVQTEIIEDEYEVEENILEEPKSKLGDIYQLGEHRLMCGDSTKEVDVAKLMNGELADLVLTDPPYNVEIVGGNHSLSPKERKQKGGLTIENDKMQSEEFYNFLLKAFKNIYIALKPGGAFYIWYASREVVNFSNALERNNLPVKQELIWNKNSLVMGRQDYQWKHEPCLYGWKEGAAHYFIDDRTQTTVIEDKKPDIRKLKKEEMIKLLEEIYSDKISTTIINEDRPSVSDLHPTMKPLKLMARQIKNSSRIEESVLDLFGGSGSTLIACEQLGRKCYMMEYDPKYVDVIIDRWEQFTGKKARKIQ